MRIGTLRRRIVIQARPAGLDTYGQRTAAWQNVLTGVPARIEALSASEVIAGQATNAEATHRLTVRYHAQLADPATVAGLRAVYATETGTRYFNLQAALNIDERNRTIQITATEGLSKG